MAPKPPTAPGALTPGLKSACLSEGTTLDELCPCIMSLQRGKSLGIDGTGADMIKDGGGHVRILVVAVQLHACQPLP